MRTRIFYIGLILIIIGFLACVMSFFLLFIGIGLFLLGSLLVLRSNKSPRAKLLATGLPPILFLPCYFLWLHIYDYSPAKALLIPKNLHGNVRLVFGEKCGSRYVKTDGVKTLLVPQNGILILDEDYDSRSHYTYYFVDAQGRRSELAPYRGFDTKAGLFPCIMPGASGTMGAVTVTGPEAVEEGGIAYSDFYVFSKDRVYRNDAANQQKLDSLTTAMVNQCRQQKR